MNDIKEWIVVIGGVAIFIVVVLLSASKFANYIKNHEVIHPVDGVSCVVVSRVFHTSVDCWRDD